MNRMNNFDPEADRLRQARETATLAKLRAAATPGAVDRIEAAAVQEPDPVAVHVGILRKRFPDLPFLARPWGRPGLPSLADLAALAELAAYFSPRAILERRRIERYFRAYFNATPAEQRRIEIAELGQPLRRSPWSRLAFWRRH